MNKPEISEKELAELKERYKKLVPRPCYWRHRGKSQCDLISFSHIVPTLIAAYEFKVEELEVVKKENGKIIEIIKQQRWHFSCTEWENLLNRIQALRELDNETK